ncbi:Lipase [Macleaya cordata]|uniref:Lipase n=1 Tax=Macleaya cordata TaxID=56857 RepID=A0A200PT55_MACCD|nr:Lipase [Macleaya cordata]
MATASMATAAGAAALLYYTLNRKLQSSRSQGDEEVNGSEVPKPVTVGGNRVSHRPIQAPATWLETISTLSETLRFTYSETLGKWPIGDLAFGINFLLKRQGNLHVASVFGGKDSVQLKGSEIYVELRLLLRLLTLCWHFSKKPFPLFLEETGFSHGHVLLQEPKAGILKPAFTVLVDKNTKCFLLLIRGTHSIKDTLTAVTGAVVPFHHTVVHEGGVSNLVLGYAHCGMVAAARWIAKLATPCLVKALHEFPDYKIKVVGHSLGGGTAALLTYVMREQQEFSTTTCVTFAPAACMTWELAESGNDFITSVINGADLVPTFSTASADDLRSEVTASAWLNDLRNQIEQTRILSSVYRSASALGSRLPSIASARAKVAGAGAILRPVSNGTQVVMKRARNVAQAAWTSPAINLSSWSCMGARHRPTTASSNSKEDENVREPLTTTTEPVEPLLISHETTTRIETVELPVSTSEGIGWTSQVECSSSDDEGEDLMGHGRHEDRMTEVELWQQLEQELYEQAEGEEEEEESDIIEETREHEETVIAEVTGMTLESSMPDIKEAHRFFPPGKIMHIVTFPEGTEVAGGDNVVNSCNTSDGQVSAGKVGIFLTPRSLYSKLRLSQTMISDHFMPVYRRQIEQLIVELENELSTNS